ncbi:winged helix-turn-helix domain-containing protein, partial [Actinoallomurus spadix]|uniref:winged helix-turn-helix domain-containing protein n=1 Tax=Actinoallomurus spadix TaxID=79912 RepID=UPI0031DB8CE8
MVEQEGRFLAAVRVMRVGDVDIDSADGGVVRKNGNYVELTDPEKKVLMHWAANYGYPVPRDETVWMVLEDEPDSSNLYGRIVRSLREKVDGSSGLITLVNTDMGPAIRFGPRELRSGEDAVKWVRVEDLAIDVVGGEVRKNGEPIELTALRRKALKYFAGNLGRFLPNDEVKRELWEGQNVNPNTYTSFIRRLRVLIGDDPAHPRLLVNDRMDKVYGLRFGSAELAKGHRPQGLEAGDVEPGVQVEGAGPIPVGSEAEIWGLRFEGGLAGAAKVHALVQENVRALMDGDITTAQLFSEACDAGYIGTESAFRNWVFEAEWRVKYAEGDAPSLWSARWKQTGVSDDVLTLLKNSVEDLINGEVTPAGLFDTAKENGYDKLRPRFRYMLRDLVVAWEAKPDPALWQSAPEEPQGLAGGDGPEGLEAGVVELGGQVADASGAFGAEAQEFSGWEGRDPDYEVNLSTPPDPGVLFPEMVWGPAGGSGFLDSGAGIDERSGGALGGLGGVESAGDEMSVDGEEEWRSAPSAGGEFMLGGGRVDPAGGAPGGDSGLVGSEAEIQGLRFEGGSTGTAKAYALVQKNARALFDGHITTDQLFSMARTAGYSGPEATFRGWVFEARWRVEYAEGDAPSLWSARWKQTGVSDDVLTLLKNSVEDLINGEVTPTGLFDTAKENLGYDKARERFYSMVHDLVVAWEAKPDPALRQSAPEEPLLKIEDLEIYRRDVRKGGEFILLGAVERVMLDYFVENRGKFLTRNMVMQAVWGEIVSRGKFDKVYRRLRAKIGAHLFVSEWSRSERIKGIRFAPQGLAGGHGPEGLEAGAVVPGVQVAEAAEAASGAFGAEAQEFSGWEAGGAGSGEEDEPWWDPNYEVDLSTPPDPGVLFPEMVWGPAGGSGFRDSGAGIDERSGG